MNRVVAAFTWVPTCALVLFAVIILFEGKQSIWTNLGYASVLLIAAAIYFAYLLRQRLPVPSRLVVAKESLTLEFEEGQKQSVDWKSPGIILQLERWKPNREGLLLGAFRIGGTSSAYIVEKFTLDVLERVAVSHSLAETRRSLADPSRYVPESVVEYRGPGR